MDGFGIGSSADVAELNKALSAGYDANTSMTGGAALRVESLENSLKLLTFREEHCVLWKDIAKLPAYSTVEEYSQQTSVGSENPGFVGEGVAPEEDDSAYARKASLVKFLGTQRKVTHPMQLVRTINGDAVARETSNGILKVMRDAEFGLFWGNSGLCYNNPTVEGVEFDGLNTLIDSSMIVDLGNRNLEEGDYSDVAQMIADNYGFANRMYLSNSVAKTLDKTMLPKERIAMPSASGMEIGATVGSVKTSFGTIANRPSLFLGQGRSPKKSTPASATSTKAPAAPQTVSAGALTGSAGKWRTSQIGYYRFAVSACNRYGESTATANGADIQITSGAAQLQTTTLTITNAASFGSNGAPDYFNIYMCEASSTATPTGKKYLVGQVKCADVTANSGTTTFVVDGFIMPNTSVAFAGQFDSDVFLFKQLAPIMKMDLAVIDPSYRFMILLYGVPQLFAPKKMCKVINIKDY